MLDENHKPSTRVLLLSGAKTNGYAITHGNKVLLR